MARSSNGQKWLGAALLIVGLLLDLDPLTLVIGVPILLGGLFFIWRGLGH